VAILKARNPAAPGGVTTVYVLGMSHVSKKSCDHVRPSLQHVIRNANQNAAQPRDVLSFCCCWLQVR
jgi:hypothetical protein